MIENVHNGGKHNALELFREHDIEDLQTGTAKEERAWAVGSPTTKTMVSFHLVKTQETEEKLLSSTTKSGNISTFPSAPCLGHITLWYP